MFKWLFGGKEAAQPGGTAEVLVVTRRVKATPERAFAVFVDQLDSWWPRDLTWGKDNLATIGVEAKMGGNAFERDRDGKTSVWGKVLGLNRPEHIVIAWQIKADRTPEPSDSSASRVDVRFVAIDPTTTEVVLVHRDFPRHGDGWQSYKASMGSKSGWPRLIDLYAKAVASAS